MFTRVVFLLLGILATSVRLQIFFPGCEPEVIQAATMRCYNTSGLLFEEIMRNISSNLVITTNAQFYKNSCADRQSYLRALGCIRAEFDRCSMAEALPSDAHLMGVCDDARVNFTCLAQVDHHYPELTYCITRQLDQVVNTTMSWQEVTCQSMKVATDCEIGMIRRCDVYTADQMAQVFSINIPPMCQARDTIIG